MYVLWVLVLKKKNLNFTVSTASLSWLQGYIRSTKHFESREDQGTDQFLFRRDIFQKANENLMKILLEVVKTTVAMEETIGHHVLRLLDQTGKVQPSKPAGWDIEAEESVKPCVRVGYEKGTACMVFCFMTGSICMLLLYIEITFVLKFLIKNKLFSFETTCNLNAYICLRDNISGVV